ncbi:MAG: tetratricopeptide repeat protein [Chthoniobacterales bacterium]
MITPAERSAPPWRSFAALALLLTAVIAYLPALRAGFIWDDDILLTANAKMQSLQGLKEIWLGQGTQDYTPLTLTSFWLEKRVWGDSPLGYHVVNILLHGLTAILLWRILAFLRISGGWLGALLFTLHPVNVASVAWIAERKNTLSTILFFASALAFLASSRRRHLGLYLLSVGCFLLSGLSKGAVATAPLILGGALYWMNGRLTRRDTWRLVPFVFIAGAISFLTIKFQARAPDFRLVPTGWDFWIARAGIVVWHYLGGIFFPVGLSPMMAPLRLNLHSPIAYLPALLVAVVLAVFFWQRKRWGRPLLFVAGYYLLTLLPVFGFVRMALQQETPVADWWQYLAAAGIFAAIGAGVAMSLGRVGPNARRGLVAAVTVVLALLLLQTWRRADTYRSMETYCRAVVAEDPHAWTLQNNLGVVLKQRGQFAEAITHYRLALQDNPRFVEVYNNLGNALSAAGQPEQAKTVFLAGLKIRPGDPGILGNLAESEFRRGAIRDALAADAEAIRGDRYNPRRYVHFGRKLAANRQYEQAAVCFRNALVLAPGDLPTQILLIQSLLAAGHHAEASRVCEEVWVAAQKSGDPTLRQTIMALREQCAARANATAPNE